MGVKRRLQAIQVLVSQLQAGNSKQSAVADPVLKQESCDPHSDSQFHAACEENCCAEVTAECLPSLPQLQFYTFRKELALSTSANRLPSSSY